MISVQEEIAVPSPRSRVWDVVSNPSDVVSCIAGAELGAAHDDGSFDGALVVRFGAIRVRFAARITLELNPAEFEGRLSARGGDGQGATRFQGGATFRVVEDPTAGGSQVIMDGEVTLRGKLASIVESGAGVVVSRMTKDFTARLIALCGEPASAAQGGEPAAAAGSTAVTGPADREAGTPWTRRLRAWLGRLLRRGQQPQAAPGEGEPDAPSPQTRTQEVGSGNTTAQ